MFKIRKATLKDLNAIQALNNQLFDLELECFDPHLVRNWPLSSEGKEYFTNAIKNDYVIVAETQVDGGGILVGYLLAEKVDIPYYAFPIVELCNMCVDKDYRKHGIGKLLFAEFEKHFTSLGITNLTVTASYKNSSAQAFYKKMGFTEANLTFTKFTKN